MTKASIGTIARAKDKGDRTSAREMQDSTNALQRLLRECDRVSWRIPFRPSDSILYPDPNKWTPTDLKD